MLSRNAARSWGYRVMTWDDDRWRDGYDAWKLRSPDDEYPYPYDDEPEQPCDHDDCSVDPITGRVECHICGVAWYQTKEEMKAESRRQQEYDKWQRQQERHEFWRRLTYPIRWPVYRLLNRIWPRKACSVLVDDEIPF